MIQTRSVVKSTEDSHERATPQEIRDAINRMEFLANRREELITATANLPEIVFPETQAEYFQYQEQMREIENELSEAFSKQDLESRKLAKLLAENRDLVEQNQSIPAQLEDAEHKYVKTQSEWRRLTDTSAKPLRIGIARSSSSGSYLFLLRNDKLYFARKPTLFGNGFNTQQVEAKTLADSSLVVYPKEDAGWEIGNPNTTREFAQIMKEANASGLTLTFAVWPESYEEFAVLREEMVRSGILFQLWPQADGEDLRLTIGVGGRSIVQ